MASKDARTYFTVSNGYVNSPKIARAGGDAGWLDVCAIDYCSGNLTDGILPKSVIPRLSDRSEPLALARRLLDVNRWHEVGHTCDRCPQPGEDEYVIHDYLEHQRSREKVEADRRQRVVAGQRGGQAKAAYRQASEPLADRYRTASEALERMVSDPLSDLASESVAVSVSVSESYEEQKMALDIPEPPDQVRAKREAHAKQDAEQFDQFWFNFPRKVGKPAAKKAWAKAVKRCGPEQLIAAAASYRARSQGKDPEYVKTPGPWLNDDRWEAELNEDGTVRAAARQPAQQSRTTARNIGDVPTWEM